MPTDEALRVDYSAVADRLEMILSILSGDTVGAQSISVDYVAFHRAIEFCRRESKRKRKRNSMPEEEWEMIQLLGRHNQCLNWVYEGDPTAMILTLALGTSSQRPTQLCVV